ERAEDAAIPLARTSHVRLTRSLVVILAGGVGVLALVGLWLRPIVSTITTSSARTTQAGAVRQSFAAPFAFEARTLERGGNWQRETKSRVVLADGKISVKANDNHRLLHEIAYDDLLSISYSRGFDPFWNAPTGPQRVTTASGGALDTLGIRAVRDGVSLRTTNAKAPFLVLRFDNE